MSRGFLRHLADDLGAPKSWIQKIFPARNREKKAPRYCPADLDFCLTGLIMIAESGIDNRPEFLDFGSRHLDDDPGLDGITLEASVLVQKSIDTAQPQALRGLDWSPWAQEGIGSVRLKPSEVHP